VVNLRYHIVSIVAVFLALGIGVVMGTTVVERVTVDTLNDNLRRVEGSIADVRAENAALSEAVAKGAAFAEQAADQLVAGALAGVPVLVVTTPGIDRQPVEALLEVLATAGAAPAGLLRFSNRMNLETDVEVRSLAEAVGVPPGSASTVRQLALNRLAFTLDGAVPDAPPLGAVVAAGFATYEPPATGTGGGGTDAAAATVESFPIPGLRVVVVSGPGTEVPDAELAEPFTRALVQGEDPAPRVVAAVLGPPGPDQDPPEPDVVGLLRADGALEPRLSTVDNLATVEGRIAAALAVRDLAAPRTGHFGVGPGADRLLPGPPA